MSVLLLTAWCAASPGAPVPAEPAPGCVEGVECLTAKRRPSTVTTPTMNGQDWSSIGGKTNWTSGPDGEFLPPPFDADVRSQWTDAVAFCKRMPIYLSVPILPRYLL